MPAPNPHQPLATCPTCGYDMRSLLATGIRRCPECGKTVPRGLFIRVEPKHPTFYVGFLFLSLAPAFVAIAVRLFFAAASSNPMHAIPQTDILATVWLALTPIYCYILTFVFCSAHNLPRASFGALPVSVPVVLANVLLAAAFVVRN